MVTCNSSFSCIYLVKEFLRNTYYWYTSIKFLVLFQLMLMDIIKLSYKNNFFLHFFSYMLIFKLVLNLNLNMILDMCILYGKKRGIKKKGCLIISMLALNWLYEKKNVTATKFIMLKMQRACKEFVLHVTLTFFMKT